MNWTKEQRKEYNRKYYQAHKEQHKALCKAWKAANKEQYKAYQKTYQKTYHKAWCEEHREDIKEKNKALREENREEFNKRMKRYYQKHREEVLAYRKSDVNSLGQRKDSIRKKSRIILKKSGIKIPGYENHHCFGYDDPSKFIYCSKELHLKIHQFLRDNNIDAASDHWMAIRDLVNSTDEFVYIKC